MDFDKIQDELIRVYQDADYKSSNKMLIKLKLRTPSRSPLRLAGYLHNISKVIDGDGVKFLKDLGLEKISGLIDEYQKLATSMDYDHFPGIVMCDDEKEIYKKKTDRDLKFGIGSCYMLGAFIAKDKVQDLDLSEKIIFMGGIILPPSFVIPNLIEDYKKEIS